MRLDDHLRRSVPWRLPDLYLAAALVATGVVFVAVARVGAGGRDSIDDQVPWVSLGVGGLVVVCLGCVTWVLAGMRATAELRRLVVRRAAVELTDRSPAPEPAPTDVGVLVAGPAMTRYHSSDCQLVAGKDVQPVGDGDGRQPCAACLGEPVA